MSDLPKRKFYSNCPWIAAVMEILCEKPKNSIYQIGFQHQINTHMTTQLFFCYCLYYMQLISCDCIFFNLFSSLFFAVTNNLKFYLQKQTSELFFLFVVLQVDLIFWCWLLFGTLINHSWIHEWKLTRKLMNSNKI